MTQDGSQMRKKLVCILRLYKCISGNKPETININKGNNKMRSYSNKLCLDNKQQFN